MPDKQTIYEYLVSYVTDKIVEFLMEDFNLPLADALDVVYRSRTFELLQNADTELYIQSPRYVYERLLKDNSVKQMISKSA